MNVNIIEETPDYLVCIKPQGVESEHEMPALLKEQLGCNAVYPVHRLDKETGGLMVYAKTKAAAADLSRQVQNGKLQKAYFAVAAGVPSPCEGQWEDWLYRDRRKNKSYLVKRERKGVKKASLSYAVLEQGIWQNSPVSLVRVALHTGRTHQIRVQFSGRNHPLIGDRRYGGAPNKALCLWSAELSFFHGEGERRWISRPPEQDGWLLFDFHNFE